MRCSSSPSKAGTASRSTTSVPRTTRPCARSRATPGAPVQIEEGKPRRQRPLDLETGFLEHPGELPSAVVRAMADVAVVRRHRAAGYGHDQAAAGSEVSTRVAEQVAG